MVKAAIFAVTLLGPQVLWAQCVPGEQLFAACRIEGRETQVSVCFTPDTATYRFGPTNGTPDLVLTTPMTALIYQPWPGIGRDIWESVSFDNKDYRYQLSVGLARIDDESPRDAATFPFGSLRVEKAGAVVAEMICKAESVTYPNDEGIFAAKEALGLEWNPATQVWVPR